MSYLQGLVTELGRAVPGRPDPQLPSGPRFSVAGIDPEAELDPTSADAVALEALADASELLPAGA